MCGVHLYVYTVLFSYSLTNRNVHYVKQINLIFHLTKKKEEMYTILSLMNNFADNLADF